MSERAADRGPPTTVAARLCLTLAHTGPGATVWSYAPGAPAYDTGQGVPEFTAAAARAGAKTGAMGTSGNAHLLSLLYRGLPAGDVFACSPLASATSDRRRDPAAALADGAVWNAPASTGGWDAVGAVAAKGYALADHSRAPAVLTAADAYAQHPVLPLLAFVHGLDVPAAARLAGLVTDPRFYADPEHPDSPRKLYRHLGLEGESRPRHRDLVAACWAAVRPHAAVVRDAPGCFLWRLADRRGPTAACQKFVLLLCGLWRQLLTPGRELFVPTYFFDYNTREAFAALRFYEHAESRGGLRGASAGNPCRGRPGGLN